MKRSIIFFTALFVSLNVFANDAIHEAVKEFDAVEELKDYYDVLNNFERIILQGDCDWIPYYYSSLCLINIARQSELEKVDEYCDKADEYLKEADKLNPNNSEVYCLKALSASTRIRVNFEERGFRYVTLSNSLLEKAKSFNDSNPRFFYLKGMNTVNLPAMMGGGPEAALPFFEKALALFKEQIELEKTVTPHWGRESCESIIEKLNNL